MCRTRGMFLLAFSRVSAYLEALKAVIARRTSADDEACAYVNVAYRWVLLRGTDCGL